MPRGFWADLSRPFWVLGPMEELTEGAFRRLVWELAPPHVFFTEFVRCEQLSASRPPSAHPRLDRSLPTPGVPLVAQLYGTDPRAFERAARLLRQEGWAGIDLNMGCPARKIRSRGAGSGLILRPDLAQEIFWATREGAGDLPVSIKTRIGFATDQVQDWLGVLLRLEPDALTVHGRLAIQLYSGHARWEAVGEAVRLRVQLGVDTLIIGNGDITSVEEGQRLADLHGCDGLMVARAALQRPWFWMAAELSEERRLAVARRFVELYHTLWAGRRPFGVLKKHLLAQLGGTTWLEANRDRLLRCQREKDFLHLLEILA